MNMLSIDLLIPYVAKGLMLFTSIVLYIYLFSAIIPRFIMKVKMEGTNTCDRGIKKFIYPNGRCVLYEPELEIRKYITAYTLYTEGGYKYIKCKATDRVSYLRYDVYAFDNRNKLIDIIGVSEAIDTDRYTDSVSLPPETSYVRLVLRRVDKEYFSSRVLVKYSLSSYLICSIVVALATVLESMFLCVLLKDLLLNAFALKIDLLGHVAMIAVIVAISLAVAGFTVLAYRRNCKKVINR